MWIKTHSAIAKNITREKIWAIWSDINNRPAWDLDTEWAELKGPFKEGAVFRFKPKGGPRLSMTITECTPNVSFTDCYKFPFARLYGSHSMKIVPEGLQITVSMKTTGALGFLLRKIVGEKVAADVPAQTKELIKLANNKNDLSI